ncbi:hypothetical protein SAMN05443668_104430 [Cryptosporangium aurantiacum]|uniref:Uncharacterized protein n=1 Tax=Cryptosporangium aurantiacum TaxID=134849 RepID=A0A1M7QC34_9ACTN|nr:hypothetical protein SAMN05443668_104430 [Cryptosporangium aurantiacum]
MAEGPKAPVADSEPLTPAAAEHRLPVGVQIGVALLFLYLVLGYFDRRFLLLRRRNPKAPKDTEDAGLDLVHEHTRR